VPGFRATKAALKPVLESAAPDWSLGAVWAVWGGKVPGMEAVGPLFAFLAAGETARWRAVAALGRIAAHRLAAGIDGPDDVRDIVRRLMWRLNEDSGNLGWGGAEAMGEILAASPELAAEYGRILLSYVRDTGRADNYLEHPPLRRGAYWGIARLAAVHPPLRAEALSLLLAGFADEDSPCRATAIWGVGHIAARWRDMPEAIRRDLRRALAAARGLQTRCAVLDGDAVRIESAAVLAREALDALA
jgi:hypothetical protein